MGYRHHRYRSRLVFLLMLSGLMLASSALHAADQHTMQLKAAPASPRDSVVDELASIVVLCAKRPHSDEFIDSWRDYLQAHYDPAMDVDGMVDAILTLAKEHRRTDKTRDVKRASSNKIANEPDVRKRMHDTAKATINNMKG